MQIILSFLKIWQLSEPAARYFCVNNAECMHMLCFVVLKVRLMNELF